jgi:hypothetical protein|tara:strand:+ start:1812 stop:1988 length:177 start_codon:yes stop_codon:yes gene_type:complete
MKTVNQLATEIATEIVELRYGENGTWEYDEGGQYTFTELAQNMFNELYDIVHNKLTQV